MNALTKLNAALREVEVDAAMAIDSDTSLVVAVAQMAGEWSKEYEAGAMPRSFIARLKRDLRHMAMLLDIADDALAEMGYEPHSTEL